MANTGAIRAGGAFVEISTKNAAFMKGLNASAAKLKAWGAAISDIGKKLALAGLAAGGLLAASLKVFAGQGDELAKMSQRTGVSVEALSELGYAAEQSGSSIESLEKGIRKMQQGLTDAGDNGGAAAEAFTRLGLTVADLQKMSPEDQFLAIADRLSKVQDPTLKAAIAMQIFGRAGTELLPMLSDGVEGVDALRQRARELGLTMSTDAATGAVVFGDNLADVWKQVKKVAFEVGASLAPALIDLLHWFQKSLAGIIAWVKANREVIIMAAKIAAGVVVTGAALIALGTALKIAGAGMAFLSGTIYLLTTAFTVAKAGILLLLTPVGAVAAAVIALGVVVAAQTGIIGDAVDWLVGAFKSLAADAVAAFGGIADALAAGEIGKAAAVLWAFLKLEWTKGINALEGYWFAFKQGFIQSWQETVRAFATIWISGVGLIKVAWASVKEFVLSTADSWLSNAKEGLIELQRLTGLISETEANNQANSVSNASKQRQADIKAAAQKERQDAIDSVAGELDGLAQDAAAADKARNAAADARLAQQTDEVRTAQDELAASIADAADARAKVNNVVEQKVRGAVRGADDDAIGVLRNLSVKGIFNPRAIQSLQAARDNPNKPVIGAIDAMHITLKDAATTLTDIDRQLEQFYTFE